MAGRHAGTSDFRAADTIKLTAVLVLPLVFLALLAFGAFLLTQARITQNAVVWAYAGDVLVFGTLLVVQIVRARRTRSRFPWLAACSLALWGAALVNVGIPAPVGAPDRIRRLGSSRGLPDLGRPALVAA
jgi:hypothetical protein